MTLPPDPLPATPATTDADAWLSDIADGRLAPDDLARRCSQWAEDPACRRTWHAYHLIGDVLRSEDLAQSAAHDAAFLGDLRKRLAREPVVLAPAPQTERRPLGQVWALPLAVAAGFMAVAGVLVVLQQVGGGIAPGEGQVLAAQPVTGPQFASAAGLPGGAEGRAQMLRDARVDEYLQMHRQALAGSPVALPGGAMRSVDLTMPTR